MATNTTNHNFKKPDESDYYSIQDQNNNWDEADKAFGELEAPTFEDYTNGTTVPDAATALAALKSKIKLPVWMSNVVAFCKGCCTLAMIVNNSVSDRSDLPVSAAVAKSLQEQITKLNGEAADIRDLRVTTYLTDSNEFSDKCILDLQPGVYICKTTTTSSDFIADGESTNIWGYGTMIVYGEYNNYKAYLYITAHAEVYIRHSSEINFHCNWKKIYG
jgi:hypothetical protein